jgi:hypothetical protein
VEARRSSGLLPLAVVVAAVATAVATTLQWAWSGMAAGTEAVAGEQLAVHMQIQLP